MIKPIKIAYIIDSITTQTAGTENQLLMQIKEIDKSKFKPYLICLQDSEWLKNNKAFFDVKILGVDSLFSLSFIKALIILKKFVIKEKIDIIQTFFKDGNLFGTIAAKFCGVKIVLSSRRNLGGGHWHNRKWLFILRLLSHWTTMYVANSKVVEEYTIKVEQISKNKIVTIYNGLKLREFGRITPQLKSETRKKLKVVSSDVLIGLVANWRPVKNIPLFLKVAFMLNEQFCNIKFIVIGKPPSEKELFDSFQASNLPNNISFIGEKKDVIPYLAAMDIGVLCSTSESLSNSITEYLAAGLPCVVSNVGGNAEAIGYGEGGLLFENNNEYDFFNKLKELIINKQLRNEKSKNAKNIACRTYNYHLIVKSYEKLYLKLIEEFS